jgi:uncharacterized membrane protein
LFLVVGLLLMGHFDLGRFVLYVSYMGCHHISIDMLLEWEIYFEISPNTGILGT